MRVRKVFAAATLGCAGLVGTVNIPALATDLTGIWAHDVEACDKVFVTKGKKTSFRRDSDLHGSGFIIEGSRLRGRTATCTVTRRAEKDDVVHMVASCATDIMFSNVQFSLKIVGENRVERLFPGLEGMEMTFFRCPSGPATP